MGVLNTADTKQLAFGGMAWNASVFGDSIVINLVKHALVLWSNG
jgi:hypothetical protein